MPSARDSTAMPVNSLLPAMLRKEYRMSCANGSQKCAVLMWRLPPWGSIYVRRCCVVVVGPLCSIRRAVFWPALLVDEKVFIFYVCPHAYAWRFRVDTEPPSVSMRVDA